MLPGTAVWRQHRSSRAIWNVHCACAMHGRHNSMSVEKNRTVHMHMNRIKQRAQDSAATGRQKDLNLESVYYKVYSTSMEIEPWICPIEHAISFMNGPSRTRVQTNCIHFAIWHAYPHWIITNRVPSIYNLPAFATRLDPYYASQSTIMRMMLTHVPRLPHVKCTLIHQLFRRAQR